MDRVAEPDQLRAAQNTYQGIPFTYTIAADTSGDVYFADASVVPNMTDAEAARCVDTPQGKAEYPHDIVDGSTTGCGWGTDPDAISRASSARSRAAADPHRLRGQLQQQSAGWPTRPRRSPAIPASTTPAGTPERVPG